MTLSYVVFGTGEFMSSSAYILGLLSFVHDSRLLVVALLGEHRKIRFRTNVYSCSSCPANTWCLRRLRNSRFSILVFAIISSSPSVFGTC